MQGMEGGGREGGKKKREWEGGEKEGKNLSVDSDFLG